MSPGYVYALVGEPVIELPSGLAGEALRAIDAGGLWAILGDVAAAPSLLREALVAHDRVVKAIAARVDAILPMRFGTVVAGEAILVEQLASRSEELREALIRVKGREQMTLRIYERDPVSPGDESDAVTEARRHGDGPGARFLASRRARHGWGDLAPLRAALSSLVTAERIDPHRAPPLHATIYHLVPRGSSDRYSAALDAVRTVRVTASGPWPPYAFASRDVS